MYHHSYEKKRLQKIDLESVFFVLFEDLQCYDGLEEKCMDEK